VQRKLNESNYVVRKGKGKSIVIHVDRMHKLPISSLDGESSDSHTHTRQDNETSVSPCKRRRHSLLQTCLAFILRRPRTTVSGEIAFHL